MSDDRPNQMAEHRTIMAIDVERFGDRGRANPDQAAVRAVLYQAAEGALAATEIPWGEFHWEDRGDGMLILIPPHIPKALFIESVPYFLAKALHKHNDTHHDGRQIRLRMVLHAGEVIFDDHGVTGRAVIHAFRLLDATPLKTALKASPGALALIVSSWFFDEVVHHSNVVDQHTFRPVQVAAKETNTVGWIALPDHPYPPGPHLPAPVPIPSAAVPQQLPAATRGFAGRTAELAALTTAITPADTAGGTVVISAVAGAGGVGKTCLAVHWAHQHYHHFPDGQLFVDLRGFSPTGQPVIASEAMRGFLDALAVAPGRVPPDLDAQAALFRSLVAGKRMLIVLDNAATADQVIPLLPGTPTCSVLVTSRKTLTTLIHRYGAHHLSLDVLDESDAHALLTHRLGTPRTDAEPAATAELIQLCGRYPLALAIMTSRARAHPRIPLTDFAAELRESGLHALANADPAASMPAVLSWSLRGLSAEQRTTFALLGIAPGSDIGLPAAASLTGLARQRVRMVLLELVEASLLDRRAGDRYAMHDLIRAYATGTAHQELHEDVREAALRRIHDFYTHTAHASDRLLHPQRDPIALDVPASDCQPCPLADETAARSWLEAEHSNLLATQHQARDLGWHQTVWNLAWSLSTFHIRRGHLHDDLTSWRAGMTAAEHLGDTATQILAHEFLGHAYTPIGRHAEALDHLHQALLLAEKTGDLRREAHTQQHVAWLCEQAGNDHRALEHASRAFQLYHQLQDTVWQARMLGLVGWFSARLGQHDQARQHLHTALTMARDHHDHECEASILDSLGYLAHRTGHYGPAQDHYRQALALCREAGKAYDEADILDRLGHTHAALRQHAQARTAWSHALELYQQQGRVHDTPRIQHQLDTLDHQDK